MTEKKLTRRGLLSLFTGRTDSPPKRSSFSLSEFYASRGRRGEASDATLPPVQMRPGLPDIREHATSVGVPELAPGTGAERKSTDDEQS